MVVADSKSPAGEVAYVRLPDVESGSGGGAPGGSRPGSSAAASDTGTGPSSPRAAAARPLSLLPLIALIFFEVSGGPFGTEARRAPPLRFLHRAAQRLISRAPLRRTRAHVTTPPPPPPPTHTRAHANARRTPSPPRGRCW